jgi:hypothetical protein
MNEEMNEVATHLALKWARGGPSTNINDTEDFTWMTLDTIAPCSMGSQVQQFLFVRDASVCQSHG